MYSFINKRLIHNFVSWSFVFFVEAECLVVWCDLFEVVRGGIVLFAGGSFATRPRSGYYMCDLFEVFFLALRLNGLCVFILVVILVGLEALGASLSRLVSFVVDRIVTIVVIATIVFFDLEGG